MTIIELRNKRAAAVMAARAFLEAHTGTDGFLSTEDDATYSRMEADIENYGREIPRMEKLDALDAEMSRPLSAPLSVRPEGKKEEKAGRASDEYRRAFWDRLRQSTVTPEIRNALEAGALSEGGYLVPDEFERTLIQGLLENGIVRAHAHVITTSSGLHKIPVVASHGTASWIDEEGAYIESDEGFGQV